MHVEVRVVNGKKKYYLAASYRLGAKVAKVRIFLGTGISREQAETKAEKYAGNLQSKIEAKIQSIVRINDPYRNSLSSQEIAEVAHLTSRIKENATDLSEDDWAKFVEEFTYDTNAIEGSTVSRNEVRQVLANLRWPERSKDNIAETLGVAEAANYLRRISDPLSLEMIKELHRIVFKNSKTFAGETREKSGAEVSVVDGHGRVIHQGAPAKHVDLLLKKLVEWYYGNCTKYPPLLLAGTVHNQFENIHPFQDGNGRVGRLILANIVIKHGLPPLDIRFEDRNEYYYCLNQYQIKGDIRPTLKLLLKEYRYGYRKRAGQEFARRTATFNYQNGCAMCRQAINLPELLIASHVKAWVSSKKTERVDPANLVRLCVTHDKLFEKGYIVIGNNMELLLKTLKTAPRL